MLMKMVFIRSNSNIPLVIENRGQERSLQFRRPLLRAYPPEASNCLFPGKCGEAENIVETGGPLDQYRFVERLKTAFMTRGSSSPRTWPIVFDGNIPGVHGNLRNDDSLNTLVRM